MAANRCVLVGEHTREMVGSTRNNDDFDFANYYFDYDDEFDYDDDLAYDDGCAACGDNNNYHVINDIYDFARHDCTYGDSCSNGCNIVVSVDQFHGYGQ